MAREPNDLERAVAEISDREIRQTFVNNLDAIVRLLARDEYLRRLLMARIESALNSARAPHRYLGEKLTGFSCQRCRASIACGHSSP